MKAMTNKTKSSTPAPPTYVDFDPSCDLIKDEAIETLVIHLPGFKKEQLRVQVSNNGDLKVSGEKLTRTNGTKRSRFVKETKVSEGCDINGIRAKFMKDRLHVTMPKKAENQNPSLSPQSKARDQKPKLESPTPDFGKAKETAITDKIGNIGQAQSSYESYDQLTSEHVCEQGSILQNLVGKKRVVWGLGFAAVTMVAIGAFVVSNYGLSTSNNSSSSL